MDNNKMNFDELANSKIISLHGVTYNVSETGVIISIHKGEELLYALDPYNVGGYRYRFNEDQSVLEVYSTRMADYGIAVVVIEGIEVIITTHDKSPCLSYRHMLSMANDERRPEWAQLMAFVSLHTDDDVSSEDIECALEFLRVLMSLGNGACRALLDNMHMNLGNDVYSYDATMQFILTAARSPVNFKYRVQLVESFVGPLVDGEPLQLAKPLIENWKLGSLISELPYKLVNDLAEIKAVGDTSWSGYTQPNLT